MAALKYSKDGAPIKPAMYRLVLDNSDNGDGCPGVVTWTTQPAGGVFSDMVRTCAHRKPFTRFGVYRLVERCAARVPALSSRTITPHVLRHTTACHLVLAGVDINTVRAWLGHVSINTTNVYAETDLTLKAKAVALCEVGRPRRGRSWKEDKDLMTFLKSL